MQPFSYQQVEKAETAIASVSPQAQSTYLAGGTSLIDLMKLHVQTPNQLVDINSLPAGSGGASGRSSSHRRNGTQQRCCI